MAKPKNLLTLANVSYREEISNVWTWSLTANDHLKLPARQRPFRLASTSGTPYLCIVASARVPNPVVRLTNGESGSHSKQGPIQHSMRANRVTKINRVKSRASRKFADATLDFDSPNKPQTIPAPIVIGRMP